MACEYTDPVVVCHTSDINENEMKQLPLNEHTQILLIKQKHQLYALGNKCPHFGAQLHTGTLGQGRIRCPWHGACFNIANGDIEDFPGLDSLPCHKVEVTSNGMVKVRAKRKDLGNDKRLKNMVQRDPSNKTTYIIVGGGPAGAVCVETLRQQCFTGRIIMLCKENALPYDRTRVSKSMDVSLETIQFRNADFYNKHCIETLLGVEVTGVDALRKCLYCNNGYAIKFDKIFIATGVRAFIPPIQGTDLINVVKVRDYADGAAIYKSFKPEMNVVCLGSSFIALECAAFFAVRKANSVTIIGRDNIPLKVSFGEQIGERVLRLFRENNVNMHMNSGIAKIIGNSDGKVMEVQLIDGPIIPCDLLIMGTGTKPNTEFLKGSGIMLNDNGNIITDSYLATNMPHIYAGGDIAFAPVRSLGDQKAVIVQYQIAQYHGRIAAINMAADNCKKLESIPFFFTMLFGKSFRFAGYGSYSGTHIVGDLENLDFVQYFFNDEDTVVAVASCGFNRIVSQFAELQMQGKSLQKSDIVGSVDPTVWTRRIFEQK